MKAPPPLLVPVDGGLSWAHPPTRRSIILGGGGALLLLCLGLAGAAAAAAAGEWSTLIGLPLLLLVAAALAVAGLGGTDHQLDLAAGCFRTRQRLLGWTLRVVQRPLPPLTGVTVGVLELRRTRLHRVQLVGSPSVDLLVVDDADGARRWAAELAGHLGLPLVDLPPRAGAERDTPDIR